MKKYLVLALCVLSLSIAGCGKKDNKQDDVNAVQTPVQENVAISDLADLNAQEVDGKINLTLPKEAFGDNVAELAPKIKEARGFEAVSVNEDGSATFTMSKEQHKEWLLEYEEEMKAEIESVLIKNNFDSVTDVSYSKDYTDAKVKVDKELFEKKNDKIVSETIANKLKMYNYFAGKKPENVKVSVTFVDNATNKTIETLEY